MEVIQYKRGWCDYFTPCPYRNPIGKQNGVFVGDYDCYTCKYNYELHEKFNKGVVICNYAEAHKQFKTIK